MGLGACLMVFVVLGCIGEALECKAKYDATVKAEREAELLAEYYRETGQI